MRVELEGGGTLEVPLGEECATDPATGTNYLIQWTQDDTGSLQVHANSSSSCGSGCPPACSRDLQTASQETRKGDQQASRAF